jgi:hypothetical protein
MRHSRILAAAAAAIVITGCANMDDTQRRTATGAGVGALAGAVIGSATGGSAGTGAVVGAGVGALGTYIWSRNMENQRRSMEQATRGTGVGVTQTSDNQLKLEIPSDISFDTNSSDIRGAFRPLLDQFAQGLRDNPRTDVPSGVFRSYWYFQSPEKGSRQGAARRQWPRPCQELQRRRGPFSGLPSGELPRGHLRCCMGLP